MSTRDQDHRLEELALELEGPDRPGETYLEAVNRIRGAWTTAREILAEKSTVPEATEHPTSTSTTLTDGSRSETPPA